MIVSNPASNLAQKHSYSFPLLLTVGQRVE